MVTSSVQLGQLMKEAIHDLHAEPAFFRALLDASLFVHELKVQVPAGRRQFAIFKSPDDGQYVLPVFTDQAKADFAAKGNVQVVALRGRDLMRLTLGTPLMINPNDTRTTLYPEEIERLLQDGTVVATYRRETGDRRDQQPYKLKVPPRALIRIVRRALVRISKVTVAYVAGLPSPTEGQPDSVLIAVGAEGSGEQQIVRAVAVVLDARLREGPQPLDISYFDSAEPIPQWIRRLDLRPVYRRRSVPTQPSRGLN